MIATCGGEDVRRLDYISDHRPRTICFPASAGTDSSSEYHLESSRLSGKYGFWTLAFLVIANMIGAGVFTTSGYSLADLGSPQLVLWAWLAGGVIAVAGAISYAMLIRVMPQSGGEYLFLSRAAHPLLGYVAGWVSLIAGFSGAIAFAATALEGYLLPEHLRPEWMPAGIVTIMAIVLAGFFHGLHPRVGATTQNIAVSVKLILLATILLFAVYQWFGGDLIIRNSEVQMTAETTSWSRWVAFAGSLVWISLSYSGFNAAVYVADEVIDATRVVPRALVFGTLATTLLYLCLNAVFVFAPSAASIVGKPDVAAIAAASLGGNGFAHFVRWTIALCLLTSVLSMMMAAPRVYAKMADDGMLPAWMRFRGEAPFAATVVQMMVAITLVLISDLQGLLSYLGLTLSLSAACSVCCLFLPSIRNHPKAAPKHWLIAPAFYVAATIVSAAIMTLNDPKQLIATGITFMVGGTMYVLTTQFKSDNTHDQPS
ncbi:APC family permease [Rhodopirellula baltica]|uniref:Amino acid/polyamine transporter I n=1 Tax=Rhodopirellula baltica WH47 TaxID=991778 RepID=F2AK91_RHOBT|nr:APC family permease [Rhodopirellula baltica]EGF29959.1 Amino acid/polyamine transporter I [Rhodopirellula baltica WH47]